MTIRFVAGLAIAAIGALPALADIPPPGAPVSITASANDTTGEAAVALEANLTVRLQISGGTGHTWRLTGEAGPELALVDQRTERAQTRALGAPQLAVFEFIAQSGGQKALTFGLFAPGATNESEPVRTYVLTVTIN